MRVANAGLADAALSGYRGWVGGRVDGWTTEEQMKHKGERHIPDFSKKPKAAHPVAPDRRATGAPPPPRTPQVKPQSTSAKSGRRGQ